MTAEQKSNAFYKFCGEQGYPKNDKSIGEMAYEFAEQFALQVAEEAVEEEPELEDEMPEEMFEIIKNDRDALIAAFRITVQQTKEGILKNIKKRLE